MSVVYLDFADVERVLKEYERLGRDLDPVKPLIEDAMIAAVSDVYAAEGPGWAPLAESTLERRRGSSAVILQDTGIMVGSTAAESGRDYVEAFAGAAYADYHATGTSRMPKRNPFDLGPFEGPLLEDVADMLTQHLAE